MSTSESSSQKDPSDEAHHSKGLEAAGDSGLFHSPFKTSITSMFFLCLGLIINCFNSHGTKGEAFSTDT